MDIRNQWINEAPLHWCHKSVIVSQIISNSIVCSTALSNDGTESCKVPHYQPLCWGNLRDSQCRNWFNVMAISLSYLRFFQVRSLLPHLWRWCQQTIWLGFLFSIRKSGIPLSDYMRRTKAPEAGGRLNKKDGLTRYGNSHVKDETS